MGCELNVNTVSQYVVICWSAECRVMPFTVWGHGQITFENRGSNHVFVYDFCS